MKNIIIEVHHGIGDTIHMIPTLQILYESKQFDNIDVIVGGEAQKQILESCKFIHRIFVFDTRKMNTIDKIIFIKKLKKERYQVGVISPISNVFMGSLLLLLIGCKIRIGEKKEKKIHFYNRPIEEKNLVHRVERNKKMLEKLNIYSEKMIFPSIQIQENDFIYRDKPIVGVCLGTGKFVNKKFFKRQYYEAKSWGIEKNRQLITMLTSNQIQVIMIGGAEEEKENLSVIKEFSSQKVINFVNKGSILETAKVLKKCNLVFGCDTGPIHLAAAVGTPTLTLFGPTDPGLIGAYAPNAYYYSRMLPCQYCYGTGMMKKCKKRLCIKEVQAFDIFQRIQAILEEAKGENKDEK